MRHADMLIARKPLKPGRPARRALIPSGALLAVVLLFADVPRADAQSGDEEGAVTVDVLRLAVGMIDAESRMAAIGLSSLAKIEQPGFELDTSLIRPSDNVADTLGTTEADLALIDLDEIDPESLQETANLRAVMRYWMSSDASVDEASASDAASSADGGGVAAPLGHLMVTDASLPAEQVTALLDMTLQDHRILQAARIDVSRLTPEDALGDLPIEAHEGVEAYRQSLATAAAGAKTPADGTGNLPETAAEISSAADDDASPISEADIAAVQPGQTQALPQSKPGRSFTVYFDTDEATIDQTDIQSVAQACAFAATLSSARFVISGHTDTVGPVGYNDSLSSARADAVADAIRNDPRFREVLSVIEFGEQRLAVDTGDEVDEPKNRRVEITVFEE